MTWRIHQINFDCIGSPETADRAGALTVIFLSSGSKKHKVR